MPEREKKRNLIQRLYHFFHALMCDYKDWAYYHRCPCLIIILILIFQFLIIITLLFDIVNSYKGTIIFENGYYWVGEKKYGYAFGQGKYYNGAKVLIYEGSMHFNKYDGYGILYYVNGVKRFEGEWVMGIKRKGAFYSTDGELLYDGDCKDDIYDGYGKSYDHGILQYYGYFKNGIKRYGTFYDKKGIILYYGSCVDNVYHGYGELYDNDYLCYSGNFIDGLRSGRGVSYYDNNNPSFIGTWSDNIMEYGILLESSGNVINNGLAPSVVLYIEHEDDLNLINSITEEIVIGYHVQFHEPSLTIANYSRLKYIYVMNSSCQDVSNLVIHHLPSLEEIVVYSHSFSYPMNSAESIENIYQYEKEWGVQRKVVISDCPLLKSIYFAPFSFVFYSSFQLQGILSYQIS